MSGISLFKKDEITFEHYGGPPGNAEIARLIGPEQSQTMGGGVVVFEKGISIPWTVLYDEFIVVLEGHFTMRAGDEVYECDPGDVLWIPADTPIVYEAEARAVCFYTLFPVDWKQRHGLE